MVVYGVDGFVGFVEFCDFFCIFDYLVFVKYWGGQFEVYVEVFVEGDYVQGGKCIGDVDV